MGERRIKTLAGTERSVDDSLIDTLAAGLGGALLRPTNGGYDTAQKVWNGMVDKRPALIARCAGTEDVIACVRFARDHDLLVFVRAAREVVGFSLVELMRVTLTSAPMSPSTSDE